MNKLFDDSDEMEQNPPVKRPRGRPRRIREFEAQDDPLKKKVIKRKKLPKNPKVGRPKKIVPEDTKKRKNIGENAIKKLTRENRGKKPKLNPQQKLFAEALVLQKKNMTDAAIIAGYSVKCAASIGKNLACKNQLVAQYIEELREKTRNTIMDKRERWLKELERLSYSDIGEVVGERGTIKNINEVHEDTRVAIKNITVDEKYKQGYKIGEVKKVTMHDKIAALKLLGAAHCWYEEEKRKGAKTLEDILQEATELYHKDLAMLAEREKAKAKALADTAAEAAKETPLFDEDELEEVDGDE